jgi:glutathione S-transferase
MKLYDGGRAPNPRRVRVFLAEKGITIPAEQVDLGALQHRTDAYAAINPMRRVPALALDDGTVITESVAICRYFEPFIPIRRCSAAARLPARWSKCGTGASNFTSTCRFRACSSICIRA